MVPLFTACLLRALACPVFWEEEPKFDLKPKGSNWALSLLLKEVRSVASVEGRLTRTALGIQWCESLLSSS